MTHFVSLYHLFELDLPEGWDFKHENNVYTFTNEQKMEGVFQVSCYINKIAISFDPFHELMTEQAENSTAQLVDIGEYKAVHYGVEDKSNSLIQYFWITGRETLKCFCSLLLNSIQAEEKLNDAYEQAVDIMNSLKLNPPQQS